MSGQACEAQAGSFADCQACGAAQEAQQRTGSQDTRDAGRQGYGHDRQ